MPNPGTKVSQSVIVYAAQYGIAMQGIGPRTISQTVVDAAGTFGIVTDTSARVSVRLEESLISKTGNANVTADGVSLSATMQNVAGDETHEISAESKSGASRTKRLMIGHFCRSAPNLSRAKKTPRVPMLCAKTCRFFGPTRSPNSERNRIKKGTLHSRST